MSIKQFLIGLSGAAVLFTASAWAGEPSLTNLNWLEGRWLEQRDNNTTVEVVWNPAIGDAMTGTWSQTADGVLKRYEILTMRDIDGDVFYRFDLYEKGEDGLFAPTSTLRLKLIEVENPIAKFEIVGEENWVLTMDASDDTLRGWMVDTEKPQTTERRYNYFATKQ